MVLTPRGTLTDMEGRTRTRRRPCRGLQETHLYQKEKNKLGVRDEGSGGVQVRKLTCIGQWGRVTL